MPLSPNHIHTERLDILSPLRICILRHEAGRKIRGCSYDAEPYLLADSDLLQIQSWIEVLEESPDSFTFAENRRHLLADCIYEGYQTALDDQMPRTGQGLQKLWHEVTCMRTNQVALGTCKVCWG